MGIPFLIIYLVRVHHFSEALAGSMLAVYGLGAILVGPIAGRLSDRFQPVLVMTVSLFSSGCLLIAYPFASSPAAIIAMTFAWAVMAESFGPASLAAVSQIAPPAQRKPAFSAGRLASNLGMSIGPAVGGLLAHTSFQALFWVDGLTSMLAGIVLAMTRWTRRERAGSVAFNTAAVHGSMSSALSNGRFVSFLFAILPMICIIFQFEGAMPLHIVRGLGLAESTYGLLITLNSILIVLCELPLNASMVRWDHSRALSLGALLTAVGFGLFGYVHAVPGLIAAVVLWTFGEMIMLPTMAAYVSEIAPPANRGRYMGSYSMTWGIGFLIGPAIGTRAWATFGPRSMWTGVFVIGLLSAGALAMMVDRRSSQRRAM